MSAGVGNHECVFTPLQLPPADDAEELFRCRVIWKLVRLCQRIPTPGMHSTRLYGACANRTGELGLVVPG